MFEESYLDVIEENLKKEIEGTNHSSEPMYNMIRYFLGWIGEDGSEIDDPFARGKRYRPYLCLKVAESLGGDFKKALPATVAIELFHNFTLIHDDIEDHDEFRRHRPTLWKLYGVEQAINTGDALYTLAFKASNKISNPGARVALVNAFLEVIEGQYLDMEFERKNGVSVSEYLEMITLKTAKLVSAACEAGAILANASEETIINYREFGLNAGIAYQIWDDWSGIWQEIGETGKEKGGDILKKKKTLPLIYALEKLGQSDKKDLLSIYQKKKLENSDVEKVIKLLEKAAADTYTQEMAGKYKKEALDKMPANSTEIKNLFNKLIPL